MIKVLVKNIDNINDKNKVDKKSLNRNDNQDTDNGNKNKRESDIPSLITINESTDSELHNSLGSLHTEFKNKNKRTPNDK